MPQTSRVTVRAKPGASRTRVGGSHGDDALIVAVTAKAVDGQATEAVRRALAEALGVPRRSVRLVLGATSRDKVFEVTSDGSAADLAARVAELRVSPNE